MKKVNQISPMYLCIIVVIAIVMSCSHDTNYSALNQEFINIPDPSFEAILINKGIDTDSIVNQQILSSDAEEITSLDLSCLEYGAIQNLTGINGFINLKKLIVAQHEIEEIDLNNNVNLDTLNLAGNELTSINVSRNSKLIFLNLIANELNSINGLSELTELKDLDLSWNYFEAFNISSESLEVLHISNNDLKSLDISAVPNLRNLLLTSNNLQSLDVFSNRKLETLLVSDNELNTINLTENQNLTHLYISSNSLFNLDVSSIHNLIDLKVDRNENLNCIKILDGQNIQLISKENNQELKTDCN